MRCVHQYICCNWVLVIRQDGIDWQQTDLVTCSAGGAASSSTSHSGQELGESCLGLAGAITALAHSKTDSELCLFAP